MNNVCPTKKGLENGGKAMEVVDSWHNDGSGKKTSDVQGGYTGVTDHCEAPEQDADDL